VILEFNIHSYWHAGSGRGDGPERDALVRRTKNGLPFLPARTVAGLCREAFMVAEHAGVFSSDPTVSTQTDSSAGAPIEFPRTEKLFGSWTNTPDTEPGMGRFRSVSGVLDIRSARLGESAARQRGWEKWAEDHPAEIEGAYAMLRTTKISDKTGTAENKKLKTIEVAIPVCLYSFIGFDRDLTDAADWQHDFQRAMPLLRALGRSRSRGLGRVSVRVLQEGEQPGRGG